MAKRGTNVVAIVPASTFTALPWWNKLSKDEQTAVQTTGQELATSLLQYGQSRLAIGEKLSKLRDVLEPHNFFGKFLRNFHFSKRTAYRYIRGYENAKARLPEAILKGAMARGFAMIGETEQKPLGIYTDAVAMLPPPPNPTQEQANAWLDAVDKARKTAPESGTVAPRGEVVPPVPQSPDVLLKEAYRFVHSRYRKLPTAGKARQTWVHKLIGMVLADLGVSGTQTFSPIAVPEGFKAERGRPRSAATAA